MRRLILRLAFLLPIPLAVVLTNVYVDPANIKDEGPFESMVASTMLAGNNVGNLRNCNERLLVKRLVEGTKSPPEVLVLGSSRAMQISSLCFEKRRFFNGSISGAQVEDFLGVYDLLLRRRFVPKLVVIGLDGSLLNPGDVRDRWSSLADEHHEMEAILGLEAERNFSFLGARRRYLEFASPVYFQESLKGLFIHRGLDRSFWATENREDKAQLKLADGSLVYGADVRSRGVEEVNREAMQFAAKGNALYGLDGFSYIDEARLERLDRFIRYLRSKDVEVLLFVPPYHPLVFQVIEEDPSYSLVLESERRFRALAEKHGVEIVGSFDPTLAGVSAEEFHDGMHPKRDAVERILRCEARGGD